MIYDYGETSMTYQKIGDIRVSQLGITGNIFTHLNDDLDIVNIDRHTYIGTEHWFLRIEELGIDIRFGVKFIGYGTNHFSSGGCVGVITKAGEEDLDNYIYCEEGSLTHVIRDYTGREDINAIECEVWNME